MVRRFWVIFCLVVCSLSLFGRGTHQDPGLTIAGVQFEITDQKVLDFEQFRASITRRVQQAVEAGAKVVVFPEYTNAFLSLLPYRDLILQSRDVSDFLSRLYTTQPQFDTPADFFASSSFWVRRLVDDLYGGLAREHQIYLVSGTYFHADSDDPSDRVTNRLIMYGPDGRVIHEQDKVFLTPFESVSLGLSPGFLVKIEPVVLDDITLGFTICRDAFQSDWDSLYFETDVLIDLKAENITIEEQPWDYVSRAIPERVDQTNADFGLTVHLVGSFLDLFWEGSTSLFDEEAGMLTETLVRADDAGVLVVEVD